MRQSYSSDLTDAQWAEIEFLFSGLREYKWPKRELTNAVLYFVKTGCQWRRLPHDFPHILSTIRLDGTTESVLFEGAMDGRMFEEYIKEILAPQLRPGDILIMDNLRVHKSALVVEMVQTQHADIKFLPAYNPDLNPIVKLWSKLKQTLRGLKPRTSQELFHDTGIALSMISADDAHGWFESCGYI